MGVKDGVILMGLLTIKINIKKHPLRSEGHALLRAISNTFSTSPDQQQNNLNLLFVEPYFSEIKGGLLRPFHVVFFFDPHPKHHFLFRSLGYFGPTERLTQPILRVSNEIRENPRRNAHWLVGFIFLFHHMNWEMNKHRGLKDRFWKNNMENKMRGAGGWLVSKMISLESHQYFQT